MSKLLAISVFVGLSAANAALAQVTAGVQSTPANGEFLNGSAHARKTGVFLDCGLGTSASAAALPDGDYYFQVTDPAESTLLSIDWIEDRRVTLQGGLVTAYLGKTHRAFGDPATGCSVQLAPFLDSPDPHGEYRVWLTPVASFDPSGAGAFGFHSQLSRKESFRVGASVDSEHQSAIRGVKFFDHNQDGLWNPDVDPLEVPIGGWRVELWREGVLDGVAFTDSIGRYEFFRDRDGTTYTVREVAPGGFIGDGIPGAVWLATTPREGTIVADRANKRGPFFGNVSFEVKVGVGRTKGFWHNQNGRALLQQCEPQWRDELTTLNGGPIQLRRPISSADPEVSVFAPLQLPATFDAAFADWSNYVVGQGAGGHAGYLLSTQVAAAILNRRCGYMQFDAYIDRFGDGILVSFDVMLAGAVGLLTEVGAGQTGPGDPYQDLRMRMLMCVNEFGSINNTGDPQGDQIVWGTEDNPGFFHSPY